MDIATQANFDFRFGGIGRLYGNDALKRFRAAHVCVVGIGGVGSWVVEALARSGIGKLTLVDLDDICESNINRQIHALDGAIGISKIDAMATRCRAINPECLVKTVHAFLTKRNAESIIEDGFDYVVDAIDSASHKVEIIVACKAKKIPCLTVGGAGGRIDPTQIRIADLSRSYNDPLLQRVRKLLRLQHNFPRQEKRKFHVDCVFSPEEARFPDPCQLENADASGSIRLDCASGYGAATHLTGTFGFFATSVVLSKLAAPASA